MNVINPNSLKIPISAPLLRLRFLFTTIPTIFDCTTMAISAMLRSRVDRERISSLLVPFLGKDSLEAEQLNQVSAHLDLLLKWNSRINLTAIRDPEEIVTRHFGESFFAACEVTKVATPSSAIDIGSGAGFPGVPLKILRPEICLTLAEANQKKATFLREVVRLLDLKNMSVFPDRAEKLDSSVDLVTLRAVENFDIVLSIANRLLATDGRVVLLIGESQVQDALSNLPALQWNDPIPIPQSESRVVLIGRKN